MLSLASNKGSGFSRPILPSFTKPSKSIPKSKRLEKEVQPVAKNEQSGVARRRKASDLIARKTAARRGKRDWPQFFISL